MLMYVYCNVWPEVFIVALQKLQYLPNWYDHQRYTSPSFIALHHPVSEIAECISWGC